MSNKKISKNIANILVVDDSNTNILLLTSILESEGFNNITVANNGKVAIEQIMKKSFDLVLLDIRMPKINGLDVLKYIKDNNLGSITKVVVVSANTSDNDIELGKELGAFDYLTKPINLDKLFKILTSLFE